MTTASHAIGFPEIGRPRADTIEVAPKPITRQDRARRVMFKGVAVVGAAVLLGTAQQVASHGWRAFVFRAPGVGGTPARTDAAVAAPQTPAIANQGTTSGTHPARVRHRFGDAHHRPGPPPPTGIHVGRASGPPPVIRVPATGPGATSAPSTQPTTLPTPTPTSVTTPDPTSTSPSGDGSDGDRPPRPPRPPRPLPPPSPPPWRPPRPPAAV